MKGANKSESLVDRLFNEAFDAKKCRTPRSEAYKAGVRAILELKVNGTSVSCPYEIGTAKADAFFAGCDEGHFNWRLHLEREASKASSRAGGG